MTYEVVSQCLSKVVGNVAPGSYCSLQTLTNFPLSQFLCADGVCIWSAGWGEQVLRCPPQISRLSGDRATI